MGKSFKRETYDGDGNYGDDYSEEAIPDIELDELLNGNLRVKNSRKRKRTNELNNKGNYRTGSTKLPHGWEDFDYGRSEDYRYDD